MSGSHASMLTCWSNLQVEKRTPKSPLPFELGIIGQGQFFGEKSCLFHLPSDFTVTCETASTFLSVSAEDLWPFKRFTQALFIKHARNKHLWHSMHIKVWAGVLVVAQRGSPHTFCGAGNGANQHSIPAKASAPCEARSRRKIPATRPQFAASTRAKRWGKCPSTNTAAANDPCCWQQSGNWRTQLVWGARGATRD